MTKCLAFALIAIIAVNGIFAAPRIEEAKGTCKPWLGYCQLTEQCCRNLMCAGYLLYCVPMSGIRPPGEDKRPIGPPPYPPTRAPYTSDELEALEAKSENE